MPSRRLLNPVRMDTEILSLYELNNLVRSLLEAELPGEYWLEAELSEARLASNGHFYVEFVQRDGSGRNLVAKARGTMWARTYQLLAPLFERATGERLRAGMKVRVRVMVEFHELYGYSLNIVDIDPAYTMGDMARRRREIMAQLEADGIAHDNQELPLPALLRRIAVVSSATAAGYGDFCNQLEQNEYGLRFDLQLFPAVMQGANVEESVLAALEAIMARADAFDAVVIIRGGGATSDLSDFDTYPLAAAVAQMPLPVVVGIGHERDETILDYVAHTRVKTPTAAAAFLIQHGADQLAALQTLSATIQTAAARRLQREQERLRHLTATLPRAFALVHERQGRRLDHLSIRLTTAPRQQLADSRHRLERLQEQLGQRALMQLSEARARCALFGTRLEALDPVRQLRRGYSLTFTPDGRLLCSAADAPPGTTLTTRLPDGTLTSRVEAREMED